MQTNTIPNLGSRFLESTDEYLKQNWKTLTCANMFDLYDELYRMLKRYKGNSHGFTGYSEYLLFRFLYHQVEEIFGPLKIEPIKGSQTASKFIFVKNPNLWISQSIPFKIGIKRQSPDLAIGYSKNILRVASVKIYLVNGIATLTEEIRKLETLKQYHPSLNASLIMFYNMPQKGEPDTQVTLADRPWLRFLRLRNNNGLMATELTQVLQLGILPKILEQNHA